MSKSFRFTALALLALAAFAFFPAPPAEASGYTATAIGSSAAGACDNARNLVIDHCPFHGIITTSSSSIPIWQNGQIIGYLYRCEATAQICLTPPEFPLP